jgi:4-carboxymuconolactone decarboxylase
LRPPLLAAQWASVENQITMISEMDATKMPSPAQRIPPLPASEWTPEAREVFAFIEGPEARERGARTNSVLTLANHPDLALAVLGFHKRVAELSPFPLQLRELVILRIAWLRQTQYAFAQHCRIGRQAGLGDDDLAAIKAGEDGTGWSDLEKYAVRAAGEMCETARIADATWAGLDQALDRKSLMVLLYLIGQYELNCWMFNAMRVEIEPELWEPSLPQA